MGSVRELLVAACHPWTRGVHVCTDGTRLSHAQFLGEPAVRRGNRIAELARQRSLPRCALQGRGQFRGGSTVFLERGFQRPLPPLGLQFLHLRLRKLGREREVRMLAGKGLAPRRRADGPVARKGAANHPVVVRVSPRDRDEIGRVSQPRLGLIRAAGGFQDDGGLEPLRCRAAKPCRQTNGARRPWRRCRAGGCRG